MIGKFSGGQQRRVSLACALIHCPPLLILDEPTVGTDPLLRQNIWLHLRSLCRSGMTVILTTHYIEEARSADVVAFMRSGRIIAEDEPSLLMTMHSALNLEDVFLRLCHLDVGKEVNDLFYNQKSTEASKCTDITVICEKRDSSDKCSENEINGVCVETIDKTIEDFAGSDNLLIHRKPHLLGRISALLHKNFKRLTRSWGQLIFFILLPAIQLALLLLSISDGPTDLPLAIFNQEVVNNVSAHDWGRLFVSSIDNKTFDLNFFDSREAAQESVRSGLNYAVIVINDKFSKAMKLRHIQGTDADPQTIADSQIECLIDWSNQAIGVQIERHIYEAVQRFAERVAQRADIDPESVSLPLRFGNPVYGRKDDSMRDFVIPGSYILLSFFSTASVTAHLVLDERRDGLMERSLVAGVTAFQFLLSHTLTQLIILCLQIFLMLLIPGLVFGRTWTGSLTLAVALALSQGFCGIAFGLMTSAICSDVIYAAMFTLFLFFVTIVLGGLFWPIENSPAILRSVSQFLPSTLSIESMRTILYKQWTTDRYQVYIGFVTTYVWFAVFAVIAITVFKRSL